MGLKFEKLNARRVHKGLLPLFRTAYALAFVAILICGFYVLYNQWPDKTTGASKLKDVIEAYRNIGLFLAGFLALFFAWLRLRKMDEQNAIAVSDDERKDRAHVREGLQHAVELLENPADGLKYLAISQMEQLGDDYPTQTLDHAVRSLCRQIKEYSPFFSELEKTSVDQVAKERVNVLFNSAHESWLETSQYEGAEEFVGPEPTREDMHKKQFEIEQNKRKNLRSKEMKEKLVGAINRLALRSIEQRYMSETLRGSEKLPMAAPIDLRGVDLSNLTFQWLGIFPDRFGGCNFFAVTFVQCTFKGEFNASTKFRNCKFENCTFQGVLFRGSSFFEPHEIDGVRTGSTFTDCTFIDAKWTEAVLCDATFKNTRIGQSETEKVKEGLIDKNKNFFVNCNMNRVEFEIGQGEIGPHLRWNYQADDFGTCYVTDQLPIGLDAVRPRILIEPAKVVRDHQYFDVVDDETGRAAD